MRRFMAVGLITAALAAVFAVPAFALGGTGYGTQIPPSDQDGWHAMYQACLNGDWEAMSGAMDEIHGADFAGMPCFGATSAGSGWTGGGTTGGGGMMHGGWGGMMGW